MGSGGIQHPLRVYPACGTWCTLCVTWCALSLGAVAAEPLRLVQTIALPGVAGRIDHLAVDVGRQRLFVAALGNNTLEIVDLKAGRRVRTIPDLDQPTGVAYAEEFDRLFVANAGDGSLRVFGGDSLRPVARIGGNTDADNVRYDAGEKRVYVGCASGSLAVFDAERCMLLRTISLPQGHPESFQLDPVGWRIFVNIPAARSIAVVDREHGKVDSTWPLGDLQANFPMAVELGEPRLLVGTRRPARLVVLDTNTGKRLAALPSSEDADDLFFDPRRSRIYMVCGGGSIDVFAHPNGGGYVELLKVPSAPGARTGLFVPELDRLYVAQPHRAQQSAGIRVYAAGE